MKYFSLVFLFILFSCGNKEDILLSKSNVTIVSNVVDHSPIYIFFRTKEKDTLAEVNRKNSIISTNWILNIDKRLPLRLVIPEVMKLQDKKRNEVAHKNELAQNYYSYADSIHKNLAFLPFTKVYYVKEKPKSSFIVFFSKKNEIFVDGFPGSHEELKSFLNSFPKEKLGIIRFGFAKELSFGTYIQNKVLIQSLKIETKEEFIY
ncbi:hypothetical protein [Flavobacterium cellulosilyticum]|uniref:Lipoprotein n=1 Tax=Flavobacterium cellulosilyticum TaxID=2541731 RepID=A0A4R5CI84_9FLAO|nr:hypothetical protein [Flavobacterium cellulosilyticum]TDD97044.1 hypothetical protein E0F76_10425 [Flavobacterium cellulosilyticum]